MTRGNQRQYLRRLSKQLAKMRRQGRVTLEGYPCGTNQEKTRGFVFIPDGADSSLAVAELLLQADTVQIIREKQIS